MDKINKLDIFYHLTDAQGIQVVVNTRASSSARPYRVTNVPTSVPSPIPTLEVSTLILEVDQLLDSTTILLVEESTSPMSSTKMVRDEEYPSLRDEVSPKRTLVAKDDASGELTPFIKILDIFSS